VRPPAVVVPCRHTRCFINYSDPVHPYCGRGRRSRRRGGREAVCWFSRCCRRRSFSGQREALHQSHYGRGGARGQTASSRRRSRRLETAASRRDRLGSHTAGASAAPLLGCSIQWQSGILGWTVFRLPSTPGRHVVCTVAARPPPLHALARRSAVVPVSQSGTTSSVLSRFAATARDESLRGWRGQWPPPTSSLLLAGRDTTSSTSTMTQFFWRVSPLT